MTPTTSQLHYITSVRQIDGGRRELYAASARDAENARRTLRNDPAMVDHIAECVCVIEVANGRRVRFDR